jgi:two-component system chemotaxis response regulator CheY
MPKNSRILIVEDDEAVSGFLSLALTDEGYDVEVAHNGWVGLTAIENYKPDLILLDLRMPVLDGWEFMAVYRGSPQPVPIIGVSSERNAAGLAENLGLTAFISKPFTLDDVFNCIERCLADKAVI